MNNSNSEKYEGFKCVDKHCVYRSPVLPTNNTVCQEESVEVKLNTSVQTWDWCVLKTPCFFRSLNKIGIVNSFCRFNKKVCEIKSSKVFK